MPEGASRRQTRQFDNKSRAFGDRRTLAQLVAAIVVHKDRLVVRLTSPNADAGSDSADDRLPSIPWQKPPAKKSRQILLPRGASRREVRPEQFERRARLVSAIAAYNRPQTLIRPEVRCGSISSF